MHEAFWNGLFDTRWEDAPLEPEAIRLVRKLRDCGYAEGTRREYGHAVVHLGRVRHAQNEGACLVLDGTVIENFVQRHLPICRGYRRPPGRRQKHVRRGLAQLTADDLLAFSRQRGAALGRTAWNHLATSLSGFYRWLDLCGHGARHLVGAIPLRRRYRLADVPCALSWDQVQRLLAVIDRREPNGYRNYAMLLLFASYGLRGCEVRALCLDDIHWSRDEITVFTPKTGRRRRLPLTRPVGEAILDYLREERPPSLRREIFLSSRPPHAPLRSKINHWLGERLEAAGIETHRSGAHAPHGCHAPAPIRSRSQRHQVVARARQHNHDEPVHRDRHGDEARGNRALRPAGLRAVG